MTLSHNLSLETTNKSTIGVPGIDGQQLHSIGENGLYAGLILVTPDIAKTWLPKGRHIWRKLRQQKVKRYSKQIETGQWVVDGNTIKFDSEGDLIDGQHRLSGCIDCGKPFRTIVVLGCEQHPMADTGLPRRLGDWLASKGYKNALDLGATINLYAAWVKCKGNFSGYHTASQNDCSSHQDRLDLLTSNPGLYDSSQFANAIKSKITIARSWLANLHYILTQESGDKALVDRFFEELASAVGLPEAHPIMKLRQFLLIREEEKRRSGLQKDPVTFHAVFIKSWNSWLCGEEVRSLRWSRFGKGKFPQILTPNDTTKNAT